jgi:hypothetical protein
MPPTFAVAMLPSAGGGEIRFGDKPVHYPCGWVLRMAERGKRKVPMRVASQNQGAVRLRGIVGRVAQAGWEAGGVVHYYHH